MKLLRLFRLYRLRRRFVQAFRLLRSPDVPLRLKLAALALALLILSPLNILGDIPLLGIVDDVALFGLLAGWFVRLASPYEPIEHYGELMVAGVQTSGVGRLASP